MRHEGCSGRDAWAAGTSCLPVFAVFLSFLLVFMALLTSSAHAQDEFGRLVEKKRTELAEREEALKREDERLRSLKKEVDEKVETYTKLLDRIEETLRALEVKRDERIDYLVKVYESMSPEEAASRLSAMDESTAIKIILKMKNKKAGAVMASLEPRKAAAFSEDIAKITKKFPIR